MYYKCEKCSKTWYYPVSNCIFCRQKTKKIIPKSFTVKGITKVNYPSIGHEKVPYYVLLLEDEFGSTHAKKTYHEYELGTKIKDESKDKLLISASTLRYDPYEAIERTIRLLKVNFTDYHKLIIAVNLSLIHI